jgi:hypothetical protein
MRSGPSATDGGASPPAAFEDFGQRGYEYLSSLRARREIDWEILNDCAKISRETERSR